MKILDRFYPPNYPIHALALNNLANLQRKMSELNEAEISIKKAIVIGRKSWNDENGNIGAFQTTLCEILVQEKRFLEAEPILLKLIRDREEADKQVLTTSNALRYLDLARIYGATGRKAMARVVLQNLTKKIQTSNEGKTKGADTLEIEDSIKSLKIKFIN